MFSDSDLASFRKSAKGRYDIRVINHHDITIHSRLTDHEWVFVSNYSTRGCRLLHRHSGRDPFHDQKQSFGSLAEALEYALRHDQYYDKKSHLN